MKRVCVIIPMYGKEDYTRRCIEFVKESTKLNYVKIDIVVVDDGSKTPFVEKSVKVIRLNQNTGFTNASNQGILYALDYMGYEDGRKYDYIHLLNNDTEPFEGFIDHLLYKMETDRSIAIASSVRIHHKGGSYDAELYGIDLIRGYQAVTKLENLKNETIECNWVPLCSSLIRPSVIKEVGLLDKYMRNHSSDLDYCLRVKMAGYKIVVVTDSRVIHHHEVTTSEHKISPEQDQRVLLEKLTGLGYAQFMSRIPLDAESNTYGKLTFEVYKK